MPLPPIWSNTVDKRNWAVRVDRVSERRGVLSVTDVTNNEIVHSELVPLSFGAVFGPDIDDVTLWSNKVIEVIDHPEKRVPPGAPEVPEGQQIPELPSLRSRVETTEPL